MKKLPLAMLMAIAVSSSTFADWSVVNEASSLNFVSVKKGTVGEVHSFKRLEGRLTDSGTVELKIPLTSVETNIPIRNERLQSMLFEVGQFAEATVTGTVDVSRAMSLKDGEDYTDTIDLALALHGVTKSVTAHVRVTKLADNQILVASLNPVVINAEDYALAQGVEKLRVIANLPSISTAVPVTFSVVFQ